TPFGWLSSAPAPSLSPPPFEAALLLHGFDCDCSPSRFRPPPDPPPRKSLPLEAPSAIDPPEPPDPPDVSFLLALPRSPISSSGPSLQALTRILDLKLPLPWMVSKISGGGVPLVSTGDSTFVYRRLLCAVHFRSLISAFCSSVEWDTKLFVCVSLELRTIALADDVLMDLTSVGSTVVLFGGPFVASVRSLTAVCSSITVVCSSLTAVCSFTVVCSPLSVFILAFGAVYLYFCFWWQLKEKFIGKVCWMNMIMAGSIRLSPVWSSLFSQYFFMYGVNWMKKRRWYCKDLLPRECSPLRLVQLKTWNKSGPWSTGHVVPGCVDQHKHNISTPIEITNTRLVENI
ncbi:BnaC03g76590D, partial [Brassica napus]